MSFPRYPSYKPTSSSWLRTIPAHWEMGQSRRRFRLRNEPAQDEDEQLTASQKHGIIKQAEFIESEGRRVVEVVKGQDILKHVEPGDFVISMRSFQGGLEYSRVKGSISSAYVMLAPVKEAVPGFFAWLFKSQSYVQALQSTTNLVRDGQALRFSNFCQVDVPIIPDEEQLAIANFLDRETAKIDALIAEQQRLIELLQEKRQAVISRAVTKGLNPNAPMKDSGVEWLGEVPEHWEMRRLKDICVVRGGGTPSRENPEYWQEEIPWVSPKDMKSELIDSAEEWISELGLQQSTANLIPEGSLLVVVRSGILKRTIPAGISQVPVAINQDIKALSFKRSQANPEFILRFIQGLSVALLPCWSKQGATVESIEQSYMGNTLICCPSPQEQQAISSALREELSKLDSLSSEARKLTIALEERRSALISAAVTGQIDVRGLVPEDVEE
jgi:type I restriction enzyme S subunit